MLVNGFCYVRNQMPSNTCPQGYYLSGNLCYPIAPQPCPLLSPATSKPDVVVTDVTTNKPVVVEPESTPAALVAPTPPAASTRCPPGTILHRDACRKLLCSRGEYYQGRCLQPACPEGTVWRQHRCLEPQYVRTVLEIENVFVNEAHDNTKETVPENVNNLQHHYYKAADMEPDCDESTVTPPGPTAPPAPLRSVSTAPSTARPTQTTTTTTERYTSVDVDDSCCSIVTPRLCKSYSTRWVCFNRRYKRCDANICRNPLIYLKAPEIYQNSNILVMPPNPPLEVCPTPGCDESEKVDCSGCAHNRRETCSKHCYHYICPRNSCSYLDLQTYCSKYPGEVGCKEEDGCLWDWCSGK